MEKLTGEVLPENDITDIESEVYENKEPAVFTVGKNFNLLCFRCL